MYCCDNCSFSFVSEYFPDCLFCACYDSPYYDDLLSPYDCCHMYTKDFNNDKLIKDKEKE